MNCSSECSCDNGASRRQVLTTAMAAAVAIPFLSHAAHAADTQPAPAAGDGGWVKTVKAADLKDNAATTVAGHTTFDLTRAGTTVMAVVTKCTHKGCTVKPTPAHPTFSCPCHGAEFDLSGKNLQGPHKPPATAPASLKPLSRYALRLDADGIIEVDTSKPVDPDAKEAVLTLTA